MRRGLEEQLWRLVGGFLDQNWSLLNGGSRNMGIDLWPTFAWAKGIKYVSIKVDSLQVLEWINGQEKATIRPHNLQLAECKVLLNL